MKHSAQGFSLFEILIVIALIAMASIPLIFNARQLATTQSLRTTVSVLADDLAVARISSHNARDQKAWGIVAPNTSSYQIVSGTPTSYTVSQERFLNNKVEFEQPFSVWFQIGTGSLSSVHTIVVENANTNSYEIKINQTGAIETHQL